MTVVHLEPWEYEHASAVGIRRFTERWGSSNAAHYDSARMEDDRTAQVAAAVCELAVAKHTNQYWGGHVWHASDHPKYRDIADVGTNVEVRRVRTRDGVALRRRQVGTGLVLWAAKAVEPEFRAVELWGWIDYDLGWALSEPSSFDDDTRYLDRRELVRP